MKTLEAMQIIDAAIIGAYLVCIAIAASDYFLGYPGFKDQSVPVIFGAMGVLGIISWFAFVRNIVKKDLAKKSD